MKIFKKTKKPKETTYPLHSDLLAFDRYYENYNVFRDKDRYFIVIEMTGNADTVNDGIIHIVNDLPIDTTVQIIMENYEMEIFDTIRVPIIAKDPLFDLRREYEEKITKYNKNLNSVNHNTYVVISMNGFIDDVMDRFKDITAKLDLLHFKRLNFNQMKKLICMLSFQEFIEQKKFMKKQISPSFKTNETYLQFKDRYVKMLTIQLFSNNIYHELMTQIMTVSPDLICSTFLKRVDKKKCMEMIDSIKNYNKDIIKEKLEEDGDLYHCSIFIAVVSDDLNKIENYTKVIKSICRKYYVSISELYHQQTLAYANILPFAKLRIPSYKAIDDTDIKATIAKQVDPAKRGILYGVDRYSKKLLLFDRKESGCILADDPNVRKQAVINEIINIAVMYPKDKIVVIGKNADQYVSKLPADVIYYTKVNEENVSCLFSKNKIIDRVSIDNLIFSLFSIENRLNINYLNMIKRVTKDYSVFSIDQLIENCKQDETVEADAFKSFLLTKFGKELFSSSTHFELERTVNVFDLPDDQNFNIYEMAVLNDLLFQNAWIFVLDSENLHKNDVNDYVAAYCANTKSILTFSGNPKIILKNKNGIEFVKKAQYCNIFGLEVRQRVELSNIFNFTKDQLAFVSEPESDKGILCIPSGNFEYTKIDF